MRVAIVSTYPPRPCGIGTFARDLRHALLEAPQTDSVEIVSIVREESERLPEVAHVIRQEIRGDYASAARALWDRGVDVVVVEHEFGIFGGPDGSYVLTLAEELRQPFVVTLHTIPARPTVEQGAALTTLCEKAELVTVFTETGRRMLTDAGLVDPGRIRLVPHGGPSKLAPGSQGADVKRRLRLPNRQGKSGDQDAQDLTVLATFGLIGPGKGIEVAVEAMAQIVEKHPDTVYVVAGRTHPEVARHDGERYRLSLERQARKLGVSDHIHFDDRFLSVDDLATLLAATDIYVTPYGSEDQIVSGSLTFALTAGCPVVSTPYFYAVDMLESGAGILFPFGDARAMADAVLDLLDNPESLDQARKVAESVGSELVWPTVGRTMAGALEEAIESGKQRAQTVARAEAEGPLATTLPQVDADHLLTLVDDVGIIQHARGPVPNRESGYCVDDAARLAMVAMLLQRSTGKPEFGRILTRSVGFLQFAWDRNAEAMHNFMSYDRRWLDEPHLGDHIGRAAWALGEVLGGSRQTGIREAAAALFGEMLPAVEGSTFPRSTAYSVMGLARAATGPDDPLVSRLRSLSERVLELYRGGRSDDWKWFEDELTYDNARLSQSLIAAGHRLNNEDMVKAGLESLQWYAEECGVGRSQIHLVGNEWRRRGEPAPGAGDEQPLDAAALVEACVEAYVVTKERAWAERALQAFDWFLGGNEWALPVYDFATGGCHDGLGETGLNANEGAESTLAFLHCLLILDAAGLRATVPVR